MLHVDYLILNSIDFVYKLVGVLGVLEIPVGGFLKVVQHCHELRLEALFGGLQVVVEDLEVLCTLEEVFA